MSTLLLLVAALVSDPGAGAAPASADGLGCVYAQLGEAGRGVVARGYDDDGDLDSLHRATARLNEAMNACYERLHWESRPVRGDLAQDYALSRSLADLYDKRIRAGGADLAAVEAVYQGLPRDKRLALYRDQAPGFAHADEKLAAELARRGEYAEDATWDTLSTTEVFAPLALAGGLDHDYPVPLTYYYIFKGYEARFDVENDARVWAMLDAAP